MYICLLPTSIWPTGTIPKPYCLIVCTKLEKKTIFPAQKLTKPHPQPSSISLFLFKPYKIFCDLRQGQTGVSFHNSIDHHDQEIIENKVFW